MNAIRKIMKREGNSLNVILPESFTASQVELIILPFEEKEESTSKESVENFQQRLRNIFGEFNADISGFKFNRDELYDRP